MAILAARVPFNPDVLHVGIDVSPASFPSCSRPAVATMITLSKSRVVMKKEKARHISEAARREMTAEALALAYHRSTHLGKSAVVDVIAATMDLIGDPLDKVWIEDVTGQRHTYKIEQARAVLGSRMDFRYLWAIPESERRNSKSRWLTAVTIDNVAANGATLFFALPRGSAQEFAPHVALVRMLAQADAVPQYGFGYAREYGNPDYFALSYVNKTGIKALDRPGWLRSATLGNTSAGNPAEHTCRPIVDVFPPELTPPHTTSLIHILRGLVGPTRWEGGLRHATARSRTRRLAS